jgi:hypothetical protein
MNISWAARHLAEIRTSNLPNKSPDFTAFLSRAPVSRLDSRLGDACIFAIPLCSEMKPSPQTFREYKITIFWDRMPCSSIDSLL